MHKMPLLLLYSMKYFIDLFEPYNVNNEIKQNEQLAEELHKPVIKTF